MFATLKFHHLFLSKHDEKVMVFLTVKHDDFENDGIFSLFLAIHYERSVCFARDVKYVWSGLLHVSASRSHLQQLLRWCVIWSCWLLEKQPGAWITVAWEVVLRVAIFYGGAQRLRPQWGRVVSPRCSISVLRTQP